MAENEVTYSGPVAEPKPDLDAPEAQHLTVEAREQHREIKLQLIQQYIRAKHQELLQEQSSNTDQIDWAAIFKEDIGSLDIKDLKEIANSGSFKIFVKTIKFRTEIRTPKVIGLGDVQSSLHDIDHVRSSFVHEKYMSDSAGRKKAEADLKKGDDAYILQGIKNTFSIENMDTSGIVTTPPGKTGPVSLPGEPVADEVPAKVTPETDPKHRTQEEIDREMADRAKEAHLKNRAYLADYIKGVFRSYHANQKKHDSAKAALLESHVKNFIQAELLHIIGAGGNESFHVSGDPADADIFFENARAYYLQNVQSPRNYYLSLTVRGLVQLREQRKIAEQEDFDFFVNDVRSMSFAAESEPKAGAAATPAGATNTESAPDAVKETTPEQRKREQLKKRKEKIEDALPAVRQAYVRDSLKNVRVNSQQEKDYRKLQRELYDILRDLKRLDLDEKGLPAEEVAKQLEHYMATEAYDIVVLQEYEKENRDREVMRSESSRMFGRMMKMIHEYFSKNPMNAVYLGVALAIILASTGGAAGGLMAIGGAIQTMIWGGTTTGTAMTLPLLGWTLPSATGGIITAITGYIPVFMGQKILFGNHKLALGTHAVNLVGGAVSGFVQSDESLAHGIDKDRKRASKGKSMTAVAREYKRSQKAKGRQERVHQRVAIGGRMAVSFGLMALAGHASADYLGAHGMDATGAPLHHGAEGGTPHPTGAEHPITPAESKSLMFAMHQIPGFDGTLTPDAQSQIINGHGFTVHGPNGDHYYSVGHSGSGEVVIREVGTPIAGAPVLDPSGHIITPGAEAAAATSGETYSSADGVDGKGFNAMTADAIKHIPAGTPNPFPDSSPLHHLFDIRDNPTEFARAINSLSHDAGIWMPDQVKDSLVIPDGSHVTVGTDGSLVLHYPDGHTLTVVDAGGHIVHVEGSMQDTGAYPKSAAELGVTDTGTLSPDQIPVAHPDVLANQADYNHYYGATGSEGSYEDFTQLTSTRDALLGDHQVFGGVTPDSGIPHMQAAGAVIGNPPAVDVATLTADQVPDIANNPVASTAWNNLHEFFARNPDLLPAPGTNEPVLQYLARIGMLPKP